VVGLKKDCVDDKSFSVDELTGDTLSVATEVVALAGIVAAIMSKTGGQVLLHMRHGIEMWPLRCANRFLPLP
jgi:hypothetical protein